MADTFTIQLQNVRLIAAHGLYAEEAIIGNELEIDIAIQFKAPKDTLVTIESTVDYVRVYQLLQEVMQEQKGLLETCGMQIVERIKQQFDFIKKVTVSIRKAHPPITGFMGSVGVTYSKRFK